MATELAKPDEGLKGLIEKAKPKIKEVLARHVDSERFARMAMFNISRNPGLVRCKPMSVLECVMEAASLGLNIGGSFGECYAVPYGDKATFILGYRGMVTLARRSGEIATIQAEVVRQGDEFDYEYGIETKFRHKPMSGPDSPITHVWAMAKFKEDGVYQFVVMSNSEVESIRKRSRASGNGPWVTDTAEMYKKTAVRRLGKMLPLSPEMEEAIEKSDRNEFGDTVQEVIDEPKTVKSRTSRPADKVSLPEPPDESDMPPLDNENSDAPSEHDQLVIKCSEAWECDGATAETAINKFCKLKYGLEFRKITLLKALSQSIAKGEIKIAEAA